MTPYNSKMELRICRSCKEEKDISSFQKCNKTYRALDCGKCLYQKRKEGIHEYYEANKDEYNKKRGENVTCECGCVVTKRHISRHITTKRHLELMTKK